MAEQRALRQEFALVRYATTHALSEATLARVNGGALFYVTDGGPEKPPLFCGFFVGPRLALTINHDDVFKRGALPHLHAVASNKRHLEFDCIATNEKLDYSVLRLAGDHIADAFFDLPAYSSVDQSHELGLVSMEGGVGAHCHAAAPATSVHKVTVSRVEEDGATFLYDGASTWCGDSGAALLFAEGTVVGMHLEVIDDNPNLSPAGGAGGGARGASKRLRLKDLSERLDEISVASSSLSKVCRALLLSHVSEAISKIHA